jgi:hypothetical protein
MWLIALLLSPALAGCSVLGNPLASEASATQAPATTDSVSRVPRVSNSPQSPCWQQIEIAKQNAWFASRKAGKQIIFEPPCLVDPPKGGAQPAPGATTAATPRTS